MKRVLYIEDSRASQLIVRRFLSDICETTAVSSVSEARRVFENRKFDLIITDFLMPDENPFEFISEIRTRFSPAVLPILLVSVSLDKAMINSSLRIGANDCLPKPLERSTFVDVVNRLLSAPYVHGADATLFSITCLEWCHEGRHYRFCPELQLTVEAATPQEANDEMARIARERAAVGAQIKPVLNVRLISQTIKVE